MKGIRSLNDLRPASRVPFSSNKSRNISILFSGTPAFKKVRNFHQSDAPPYCKCRMLQIYLSPPCFCVAVVLCLADASSISSVVLLLLLLSPSSSLHPVQNSLPAETVKVSFTNSRKH